MAFGIRKNVGRLDQILRFGVSAALIDVGFFDPRYLQDRFSTTVLGVIGIIIGITAIVQNCPAYNLAGINTYRED